MSVDRTEKAPKGEEQFSPNVCVPKIDIPITRLGHACHKLFCTTMCGVQ